MDEKTVADLWDAIKEVRADIAELQDRLDYHDERHETRETRTADQLSALGDTVSRETWNLEERVRRLEDAR